MIIEIDCKYFNLPVYSVGEFFKINNIQGVVTKSQYPVIRVEFPNTTAYDDISMSLTMHKNKKKKLRLG